PHVGSTTASTPTPTSETTPSGAGLARTTSGAIVTGRIASTIDHTVRSSPATRTSDTFWIAVNHRARSVSAACAHDHPRASSHAVTPNASQVADGPTRITGWSGTTSRVSSAGVTGRLGASSRSARIAIFPPGLLQLAGELPM